MRDLLLQIIRSPAIFNYIIMALYMGSAIRWAWARQWTDMFYWLSALAITMTVTFGYKR